MSLIFRTDKRSPITPAEYDANLQYLLDCMKGLDTLENPTADRLLVWDQSAGGLAYFGLEEGLTLDGANVKADADWLDARYYARNVLDSLLDQYYLQSEVDALLATKASKLLADKTVALTPSMSAAEIQAAIDAEPRDLGGHVLTFQFADGTGPTRTFTGFRNGELRVYGNASDNTAAEGKAVTLTGDNPLTFEYCTCRVVIRYIKCMIANVDYTYNSGIFFYCCSSIQCDYCSFVGDSTSYGRAVRAYNSIVTVSGCVVSNFQMGIVSETSIVYSATNTVGSVQPEYGERAEGGGVIGKYSLQPTGSIANEVTLRGGVIR